MGYAQLERFLKRGLLYRRVNIKLGALQGLAGFVLHGETVTKLPFERVRGFRLDRCGQFLVVE